MDEAIRSGRGPGFARGVVWALCLGVSLYAALAVGVLPLGTGMNPEMKANFNAHAWGIRLHVFGALLALACGPFQLSAKFRAARPALHRFMGRIYLGLGVGVGGLSGLYMSQFAYGGAVAKTGFAMLAILWLFTGWAAYAAIRRGDVVRHRQWMLRNFSLTFAAVTLRIYLPLFIVVAGIPFDTAYPLISWLCWVPNLLLMQWWLSRRAAASVPVVPA